MQKPIYSATFTECLRHYARANHRANVLAEKRFRHLLVGAIALGLAIVTAPFYVYPNLISFGSLYAAIFFVSANIVVWCGGFCFFTRKRFQSLKTKEFMAYATLDELCAIDYINNR